MQDTVESKLGLLEPLSYLTASPTVVRAFRRTAAAGASENAFLGRLPGTLIPGTRTRIVWVASQTQREGIIIIVCNFIKHSYRSTGLIEING